jgi:hypothetical protein
MIRSATLATAVALAIAGLTGAAVAQTQHVMSVRLPDGTIEHIRYTGDVPPEIRFGPPFDQARFIPAPDPFDGAFAQLERISAAMDREAAAMFSAASGAPALLDVQDGPMRLDVSNLPPGVQGYSVSTVISGNGTCTRSAEYIAGGHGQQPHVVTRTSGACGPHAAQQHEPARTRAHRTIAPHRPSDLVEAAYHPPR